MGPCQYCQKGTTFATCSDCNDELNDGAEDRAYDLYQDALLGI